jgi:hypothetical protein
MLSHIEVQESDRVIQERVESIKNRLRSTDEKTLMLPLEETLALVDAMAKCDGLGRWLLIHQGLNGVWTAELILRHAGQNPSEFARWLAYDAPGFRSTRERFYIFRDQLHSLIEKGNKHFVSVPCGTMEELFTLEPKNPELLQFTGVDLDPLAEKWIQEAEARYPQVSAVKKTFLNHNAFDLGAVVQNADVVVSNGLNVYVANDEEVINLYRSFASVLKKGGTLVTSHLSPREVLILFYFIYRNHFNPTADRSGVLQVFTFENARKYSSPENALSMPGNIHEHGVYTPDRELRPKQALHNPTVPLRHNQNRSIQLSHPVKRHTQRFR